MTIKRVRLNENVHEKLLHLKQQNNEKSINDVIETLINIFDDVNLNTGTLNVEEKTVSLKYSNGKLVELKFEVNKK